MIAATCKGLIPANDGTNISIVTKISWRPMHVFDSLSNVTRVQVGIHQDLACVEDAVPCNPRDSFSGMNWDKVTVKLVISFVAETESK